MKTISSIIVFLFVITCCAQQKGTSKTVKSSVLKKSEVMEVLHRTAEWQMVQPFESSSIRWNEEKKYNWITGTFYAGLFELYDYSKEEKYLDHLLKVGEELQWETRPRPYDANTYCIIQTYADVYTHTQNPAVLKNSIYTAETLFLRYMETNVHFKDNPYFWEWWTWCDALFMAPPALAKLGTVLNEPKYFEYLDENWWKTSDYLYSKKDSLFYRDDRFFEKRTKSGEKVFWSRGNGWVLGGLCRVLDELPKDFKNRAKFEEQFIEMTTKIASLQRPEGYWTTSLLDAEEHPGKESSGTAFHCYAIAWGINNGLLNREKFYPVVEKAWDALVSAIQPSGKLGYVQLVNNEPEGVRADNTIEYGTGALLLAGVEIAKLLEK